MQLGFYLVAVVSRPAQKQERDRYTLKEKQYKTYTNNTKTQDIQNIKQEYKTGKQIHKES
jgi:hypothetical protein